MSGMRIEDISKELSRIIDAYSREFVGRERTIRLIVLALVARQHIYMVSPPGTGKTMLEAVARSFGMNVFYYLYSYDVKLEDILYNVVVSRERIGEGRERIYIGYELKNPGLGTCDIHFADEMFKAPTQVLNALLGAMNERRVTLGSMEVKIPLWSLVAASNELPESADALIDRFLFRDFLSYLPKEEWVGYLTKYWSMHQPGYQRVRVHVDRRIVEEANKSLWSVDIYGIMEEYVKLLDALHERNIVLSDRRKGRILQAIAASAIIAGRNRAEPEDLEVLLYTAPTSEDQVDTVRKVLNEYLGGLLEVREELEGLRSQIRSFLSSISSKSIDDLAAFARELPRIRSRVSATSFPSLQRYVEDISNLASEAEVQIADRLARKLLEE